MEYNKNAGLLHGICAADMGNGLADLLLGHHIITVRRLVTKRVTHNR